MKNIKWHILFWVPLFFAAYVIDSIQDPLMTLPKELIFFLTQNIFLFYTLYYAITKFSKKTIGLIIIGVFRFAIIIALWIVMRYYIRYYFFATFFEPQYGMLPVRIWFPTCFTWIINAFFYAMAYYFLVKSISKQKEVLKSQEEKFQEETLALRAQINPHFLYNTLDLLYAKALPKDKELSNCIMLLADIMRYTIRPQNERGFVNLGDEATHLSNLIEINRLRFNGDFYLNFTQGGPIHVSRIIPIVLMTLTENVFKYGVLNEPGHPAEILLKAEQNGRIIFQTRNKIRKGPKELSTGIGLKNVIKRLHRAYGENYHFAVETKDEVFHASLTIFT
ncbi:sensor histidine kinase [Taibaiella koreensis]|uniref:sensor histidine kinase n=1 Tax=Taibaiella koreensis TaxID=1268548 RepID=UPI000E5A074E|nr:sensor histidine kinase [Taibaiella koreensis]